MKNKNRMNKVLSWILAVSVWASMPGSTYLAAAAEDAADTAMGRYVELDVSLPDGMRIMDGIRTQEGKLRIIGAVEGNNVVYESDDGGESWEQQWKFPEEYQDTYFVTISLNPKGGGAGLMLDTAEQEGDGEETKDAEEYKYYLVSFDTEGKMTKTLMEEEGADLRFSQSGDLLFSSFRNGIYVLDPTTGAFVSQVAESSGVAMGVCGKEALVFTDSELQRYDYTGGEPLPRDEALNEALYADGIYYGATSSFGGAIAMTEDEEGRLYYCTQKGIFSHEMGGSIVEEVADGTLCTLNDPNMMFQSLAVIDQCFYLVCADSEGPKMMKYEYDEEIPSVPQKELTVYSLRENDSIRQMAVLFQKQYPDTYVNYQVGMSGEGGMTAADALRTLNTDILTGNGPDVLFLDEMSVKTYAEKGLLSDLSGIAEEVKSQEGLLDHIACTYKKEDGLPAIVTRFGVMVAAGDPELLKRTDGFASLEELAEEGYLEPFDVAYLAELLYPACAGNWKNEDNTIRQEKLSEYVNSIKEISDTYRSHASEKVLQELSAYEEGIYANWDALIAAGSRGDDMAYGILSLVSDPSHVKIGTIYGMTEYSGLVSANKVTGRCSEKLLSMQQSGVFIPSSIVSVMNTAKEQERAFDFVKYLLSSGSQKQGWGLPVNQKAFEELAYTDPYGENGGFSVCSGNEETGEYIELTYSWPTKEESDAFYEMVKQLSNCAETEQVQYEVVIEQVRRCLSGEITADEAVNTIMQKINLYLAE